MSRVPPFVATSARWSLLFGGVGSLLFFLALFCSAAFFVALVLTVLGIVEWLVATIWSVRRQ
jgi:hypothetical protein